MHRTLLVPFLAALPVLGAETSAGLELHLASPTGRFGDGAHLDRKVGVGVGLQLPIDFGSGHLLRPKAEYLVFNRGGGGDRYKTDALILAVDYDYFFTEPREGAYLLAGLGIHSTRRGAQRTVALVTTTSTDRATGLFYNFGLGYAFSRNVGLEVKYVGLDLSELRYRPVGVDPSFMGNAVVATLGFTF